MLIAFFCPHGCAWNAIVTGRGPRTIGSSPMMGSAGSVTSGIRLNGHLCERGAL